MSESDTHIVIRLWEAIWLGGDADSARDYLADPYVRHGEGGPVSLSPADHEARIRSATGHLRGTEVQVHQLHETGDTTFVRLSLRGVNVATGNPVSMALLGEYRVVDGLIAESWTLHHTGHGWG